MVKIRLMRIGMKGAPSYRIVVADSRSPRDGRIIENIGWYNPRTEPSEIHVDAPRVQHWLSVGAQPSDSVRSLLQRAGAIPGVSAPTAPAASTAATTTAAKTTATKATAPETTPPATAAPTRTAAAEVAPESES